MSEPLLQELPRAELIERARKLGVERAEVLTRVELADEITRRIVKDPIDLAAARGFFGVARDMLAGIVDQGLHLPTAASWLRTASDAVLEPPPTKPVATVTLGEIYAAQGHLPRALSVLEQVLELEPDHQAARQLRDRLVNSGPAVVAPASADSNRIAKVLPERSPRETPEHAQLPEPVASEPVAEPEQRPGEGLVIVPFSDGSLGVAWQLTEARLQPGCSICVVALTPGWNGCERTERQLEVHEVVGSCRLDGFDPMSTFRAAWVDRAAANDPIGRARLVAWVAHSENEQMAYRASGSCLDPAVIEKLRQALIGRD